MPNKVGQLIEDKATCIQRDSLKHNRRIAHKPDDDSEYRFELFLLDDGQKKVEWKDETRKSTTPPRSQNVLLKRLADFRRSPYGNLHFQ